MNKPPSKSTSILLNLNCELPVFESWAIIFSLVIGEFIAFSGQILDFKFTDKLL